MEMYPFVVAKLDIQLSVFIAFTVLILVLREQLPPSSNVSYISELSPHVQLVHMHLKFSWICLTTHHTLLGSVSLPIMHY